MARVPPTKARATQSGPLPTKQLPNNPNASRTWKGPPKPRSKGRWSGSTDFNGRKEWVGTFDTPRLWGEARDAKLVELRAQRAAQPVPSTPLAAMTVAQFVGENGEKWPWDFNPQGRRRTDQTMTHHEQCIRAFLRDFGDRPIKGGVTVEDAHLWANDATENHLTSVIAMFNDARRRDHTIQNPFEGLSRKRTRGRSDMPDVLSADEFALLLEVAGRVHCGPYAPVMNAMIVLEGTCGCRPGELWAFERDELHPEKGEYYIWRAVKKNGSLGPPKNGNDRIVVLAPEALEALDAVPVLHPRWLLPSKEGKLMTQSNWTTYWYPVREAFTAQLPSDHWLVRRIARCAEALAKESDEEKRKRMPNGKLDFYELKHRAITHMVTPAPDGLGMASPDVAIQVGHVDGGQLIERVYVHRNADLARARMKRALGYTDEAESSGAGEEAA